MKLEGISKRISLARESRITHVMPYDSFYDKLFTAIELLDFVEFEGAERKVKYEARKYLVVTCSSCIETYFKRMARVFIDAGWIKEDFREILRHYNISLTDLLEINKKELSIGEIVSVSHSLQDLESINNCFSKMLGVKEFLREVEVVEVEPQNGSKYVLKKQFPDIWATITELLRLRHLIVHHEGFKRILGYNRLLKMISGTVAFISAADVYIISRVPED